MRERALTRLRHLVFLRSHKDTTIDMRDVKEKVQQAKEAIVNLNGRVDSLERSVADLDARVTALEELHQ